MTHATPEDKKRQRNRYYRKHSVYDRNSYDDYNTLACKIILAHTITDVEIAKRIGRSVKAIQIKRSRLIRHTPQCDICGVHLERRIKKEDMKYICGACGSMLGK